MRARGFTLIEVLAVIVATSVVLGVALSTWVGVSRQTRHALDATRETRRATAVLDAVARDLERVVLVLKPANVADPLDHPWVFYAEARPGAQGADRLKFMTRGRPPRLSARPESDLEVVTYAVHAAEDSLELWRKASPRLPDGLDRTTAVSADDGGLLLADGLAEFGVRFVDELGQETANWDSSSLVQSGKLPAAAEIRVALAHPDDPDAQPTLFRRRVVLPLRPLDFDELLDPSSAVGGGTKKGATGNQAEEDAKASGRTCEEGPCAAMSVCQAIDCAANQNPSIATLLRDIGGQPYCAWRTRVPPAVLSFVRNGACR